MQGILVSALCAVLASTGCLSPYEARHSLRWDSRDQITMSEESQVKLRAAQSRLFETVDRQRILAAVVGTMQDLGFMVEVLDEELGIVSGQRFTTLEGAPDPLGLGIVDPTYHLYDTQSLLLFSRTYRSWGPFHHRSDLMRLTVTVRQRNEKQTVVRVSLQYYLRAVEDPLPYQKFFRSLSQAMFLEAQRVS